MPDRRALSQPDRRKAASQVAGELQRLRDEIKQFRDLLERSARKPQVHTGPIEAAITSAVREVVREETAGALATHRAEEQSQAAARLLPLPEAAVRLGISSKALRSRIERGSVLGATKIGGRWHVPLSTAAADP